MPPNCIGKKGNRKKQLGYTLNLLLDGRCALVSERIARKCMRSTVQCVCERLTGDKVTTRAIFEMGAYWAQFYYRISVTFSDNPDQHNVPNESNICDLSTGSVTGSNNPPGKSNGIVFHLVQGYRKIAFIEYNGRSSLSSLSSSPWFCKQIHAIECHYFMA